MESPYCRTGNPNIFEKMETADFKKMLTENRIKNNKHYPIHIEINKDSDYYDNLAADG